jgi:hypothetical protein
MDRRARIEEVDPDDVDEFDFPLPSSAVAHQRPEASMSPPPPAVLNPPQASPWGSSGQVAKDTSQFKS